MINPRNIRLVVLGASAGGLEVLSRLLEKLPPSFATPIVIVQHLGRDNPSQLATILGQHCRLAVSEIEDKVRVYPGQVYVAPPDYHVLLEKDLHLALSTEPEVNFSRPSIDVLFETAAEALGENLVAGVLTGANHDGAKGLLAIKRAGGLTLIQSPQSCPYPFMPEAALREVEPDFLGAPDQIALWLTEITKSV